MVRVLIADDEEYIRIFLKDILESLSFNVVGEVISGDELPSAMKKTKPDILLLDINMPNLTGIEFLQKYANRFPQTCIILLTSLSLSELIGEESISGAQCFLSKNTPVEDIINAIEQTWKGFKKQHSR